ncbi:uncharacterized protein LOC106161212 isoform X2 [Lingula anatina]|uniref:Uncharacterized protein LOC106161212 isoform X2 n=1 Tax=Lingula anatina TaxID=7574 RepID=A0A2R2MM80_LINAN|nr:uncharacterized protein LOC106161212 isoform X2 [Lingula anatina]|eukprot:XP_023931315.1 uncharacterized protein LOC106161212 isoform X2 [Lingula anatina]
MHYINADGPYECYCLMENIGWMKNIRFREYQEWLRTLSKDQMVEAYRFHKLQMQLILLARGNDYMDHEQQLVFKEASHAMNLEAILEAYPDALFIQTYRDPCASTASLGSLCEVFMVTLGYSPENIDLARLGQDILRSSQVHGGNEMARFRKGHPEEEYRFCDIKYEDIVASPLNVVRKIYSFFGLTLTALGVAKMTAYVEKHPQNKYGRHKYALKRYKLTEEDVMEQHKEFVEFSKARGLL